MADGAGRVVSYGYDEFGRVDSIADNVIGSIAAYEYLGMTQITTKSMPQAALTELLNVNDLGQVDQVTWVQGETDVEDLKYWYDNSGRALAKQNLVNSSYSELFFRDPAEYGPATAYDPLGRLRYWCRGQLTAGGTDPSNFHIATAATLRDQWWEYDALSNWTQFWDGKDRHNTAYDTRGTAKEGSTNGGQVLPYQYDAQGNLVQSTDLAPRKITYDAWNRPVFVQVMNGNTVVSTAEYRYDAMGRIIRDMSQYAPGVPVTELYYDLAGNVIQENVIIPGATTSPVHTQDHVYAPDGQLILTEKTNHASTAADRIMYMVQDAEGSTTAVLTHANGTWSVAERYAYDPSGQVMVLDGNWIPYGTANAKPYGNDPKSAANATHLEQTTLWHGLHWSSNDRLYHAMARGQSFDPILPSSAQPRSYLANFAGDGAFHYSAPTFDWSAASRPGYLLGYGLNATGNLFDSVGDWAARNDSVFGGTLANFGGGLFHTAGGLADPVPGLIALGQNSWSVGQRVYGSTGSLMLAANVAEMYLVGSLVGATQMLEAGFNQNFATGEAIGNGWYCAGHAFGGVSAMAFAGVGLCEATGFNPTLRLPRLSRLTAFNDLEILRGRVDTYAQRALDYAVRKAIAKGWTLADNPRVGRLVDRYTRLAAKPLNAALVEANSPYRVLSQFGRDSAGVNLRNGLRPPGSAILDLAITDSQALHVYSGWDTTVSWRWNSATNNARYMRLFQIEEGYVREINPSVRRR